MGNFEKILIACPTSSAKNYCFEKWIENVMSFKYPNFDIIMFDNTLDFAKNVKWLNEKFEYLYGGSHKFLAISSKTFGINSVIERMAISNNLCRDLFLDSNDYTHFLSLESDVFPPLDIIENLLLHRKSVVGALYYRDEGVYRKLMIQNIITSSPKSAQPVNFQIGEDTCFIDGSLKKVYSLGLGCVLIERNVIEKIPFRFIQGIDQHPDSYFFEDLYRNKINVFADTSIICAHDSKPWGIFKQDFK